MFSLHSWGFRWTQIQLQKHLTQEKTAENKTNDKWLDGTEHGQEAGTRITPRSAAACREDLLGELSILWSIQVLTGVKKRDHYVRLGAEICSDLLWWHRFLYEWNGVGILPSLELETVHILSDASGSWCFAAVRDKRWIKWPRNRWVQERNTTLKNWSYCQLY